MTQELRTLVSQALEHISPTRYLDYKEYLRDLYEWLKKRVSPFSFVIFSEAIGLSSTNVAHLIVRGRRPLTVKTAKKISAAIGLAGIDAEYFLALVAFNVARLLPAREAAFAKLVSLKGKSLTSKLEKEQLQYFTAWYCPVIREMTFLKDFRSDPKWIAEQIRPKIPVADAENGLRVLESLDLVHFDAEKGRHVPNVQNVTTGAEVDSLGVVGFHQSMMDLAKDSLISTSESERDVGALTLAIEKRNVPRLMRELREFRQRVMAIADESREPDSVYQMNLQFFPMTN